MNITCIKHEIGNKEAQRIVEARAGGCYTEVQKLLYYPYYWVLFSYKAKTILGNRTIKASCLVDLRRNQASTTDSFERIEIEAEEEQLIEPTVSEEAAHKMAETYLVHSAIHKMKALLLPETETLEKGRVYKPFWIVKCTAPAKEAFFVLVDSVTGKYEIIG